MKEIFIGWDFQEAETQLSCIRNLLRNSFGINTWKERRNIWYLAKEEIHLPQKALGRPTETFRVWIAPQS